MIATKEAEVKTLTTAFEDDIRADVSHYLDALEFPNPVGIFCEHLGITRRKHGQTVRLVRDMIHRIERELELAAEQVDYSITSLKHQLTGAEREVAKYNRPSPLPAGYRIAITRLTELRDEIQANANAVYELNCEYSDRKD